MTAKLIHLALASAFLLGAPGLQASDSRFPYCESASSDSDGDGYGWENSRTCLVKPSASYTVTVRNLTYKQILSPVLAVTHNDDVALFEAGSAAGAGLTDVAEGGDTTQLHSELSGLSSVTGIATSAGVIPPASAATFTLDGTADHISLVSMLVNTNDAIMAVDSAELPQHSGEYIKLYAITWDAGTETNNEMCSEIPGPACGGNGGSPDDDGEGFVHIHRGLQGVGDLNAADQAWNDPVAVITVVRD